MKSYRLCVFAFIVFALIGTGSALAGNILGTITDSVTTNPISGIDLDLFDSSFNPVAANASSDATGNYALNGLPAGSYFVRADPKLSQGYVDQYSGGVFLRSAATVVVVPSVGDVTVDFSLDTGFAIQGQITVEGSGAPAAFVDLDVFTLTGEYISSVNAMTDVNGNYAIGVLPIGSYALRADPASTQFLVERFYITGTSVATATPLQITGIGDLTGIDFQVQGGGILSGVVTDQGTGLPLAGFDLDLFTEAGIFVRAGATTSATGYYEIGAVPAGSYYVRVDPVPTTGYVRSYYPSELFESDATLVTVAVGMITTPVNIAVPLGGTITGVVTDSGSASPLQGIDLDVYDFLGQRLPITAKTDATGFYRLGGLPAGNCAVRANPVPALGYATEFFNSTPFRAQATPVTVQTGMETMGVDFSLDQGGYIEGVILSQAGGSPIPGIDLDLFSDTGVFISSVDAVSSATGYYRLGPVASGNWLVQADSTPAQGFVDQYYNQKYKFSLADPVALTAPATVPNIDFNLESGGTLSGTILHVGDNLPLAGIDLDVFLLDGTRVEATIKTDAFGQYVLGPLPAGQYIVRADAPAASGIPDEYFDNADIFGDAQPVTVSVGMDTSGIDFLLGVLTSDVAGWNLYR